MDKKHFNLDAFYKSIQANLERYEKIVDFIKNEKDALKFIKQNTTIEDLFQYRTLLQLKEANLKRAENNVFYSFRKNNDVYTQGLFIDSKNKRFLIYTENRKPKINAYILRYIIGTYDDNSKVKDIGIFNLQIGKFSRKFFETKELIFFGENLRHSKDNAFKIFGNTDLPAKFFLSFLERKTKFKNNKKEFLQIVADTFKTLDKISISDLYYTQDGIYKTYITFIKRKYKDIDVEKIIPIQVMTTATGIRIFIGDSERISFDQIKNIFRNILLKDEFNEYQHLMSYLLNKIILGYDLYEKENRFFNYHMSKFIYLNCRDDT